MKPKKGFKQFPFMWRDKWLEVGKISPTAAYVWAYMNWRSDKDDIFDLCEGLICADLGLNRKTLCAARSLIAEHGGFEKLTRRNERGQLIVTYKMLGFTEKSKVENPVSSGSPNPKNGTESRTQKTVPEVPEPSPNLRDPVKRGHTVDTLTVDKNQKQLVSKLVSSDVSLRSTSTDPVSLRSTHVLGNLNSSVGHESEDLKWYEEYISNEPGYQRYYNISLPLADRMGATITEQEIPYLNVIVKWADLRIWEDEYPTELYRWSQKHPFWKKRIVSFSSLANAICNQTEKGIAAQYSRFLQSQKEKVELKANGNGQSPRSASPQRRHA